MRGELTTRRKLGEAKFRPNVPLRYYLLHILHISVDLKCHLSRILKISVQLEIYSFYRKIGSCWHISLAKYFTVVFLLTYILCTFDSAGYMVSKYTNTSLIHQNNFPARKRVLIFFQVKFNCIIRMQTKNPKILDCINYSDGL